MNKNIEKMMKNIIKETKNYVVVGNIASGMTTLVNSFRDDKARR